MSQTISVFAGPPCTLRHAVEHVEEITGHDLEPSTDETGRTAFTKSVMGIHIDAYVDHEYVYDCGISFSRYPVFVGFTCYSGPDGELRTELCRVLARRLASVMSSSSKCECLVVEDMQLLIETYPPGGLPA